MRLQSVDGIHNSVLKFSEKKETLPSKDDDNIMEAANSPSHTLQ